MYLRRCYRAKDGKRHAYWALVQSVRTARGPRQTVVAYLGELDEEGRLGVAQAAQGDGRNRQGRLFGEPTPRLVQVDLKGVRVERSRAFGGPWLGLQILKKLGLMELMNRLMPPGREEVPWPAMAVEGAFRIHKRDLELRPIWHQKESRVKAHILVCFLGYVLWKTLGRMCAEAGLGDEPRKVLEEIGRIGVVDVVMSTSEGIEIRKRCVTRPTEHQAILLHRLNLHLPDALEVVDM
jgi:hypothetical protein